MAVNPETKVTNRFRKIAASLGAHFIKLSDSFTRGVPDAMVVVSRVVMIEFKVDRSNGKDSIKAYKKLGLSGAQDHHIRQICRRTSNIGACVVTDTVKGDRLKLWVPIRSDQEGPNHSEYEVIAKGDEVYEWLKNLQT